MLFMVIERFKNRDAKTVYERHREKGRIMPEGLEYVASWTETNFDRCFQVMQCENSSLVERWTDNWKDLMDFEIVPVMSSAEASARTLGQALS